MQTFITSHIFADAAASLDRLRLGKQRVEAKQILLANLRLEDSDKTPFYSRVRKHPVARAWKGFEFYLAEYGKVICTEWTRRGYKDTLWQFFYDLALAASVTNDYKKWWKDPKTVRFYQALLHHKSPELYPQWRNVVAPFGIDVSEKGATTKMLQGVGAIL